MHVGQIVKTLDLGSDDQPRLVAGAMDDNTIRNFGQIPLEIRANHDEACLRHQALLQPIAVIHIRPRIHELIHHETLLILSRNIGYGRGRKHHRLFRYISPCQRI